MQHISVIGSGTMGNGIAHAFAQKGYLVSLIDISEAALQRGLHTISGNLDRQIKKGTISEADKNSILQKIQTHTSVAEGVRQADLVIEAASENLEVKLQIFKELDAGCPPETILASNTSSISITRLGAATQARNIPPWH